MQELLTLCFSHAQYLKSIFSIIPRWKHLEWSFSHSVFFISMTPQWNSESIIYSGPLSVIVLDRCTGIDLFWTIWLFLDMWCDSYSDLPACINEAAEPEEQTDQQGGEPGPEAHPNGHHSGGFGTGAKCTHVGSSLKCWYRIQRVYTLGNSLLSLDHSPAWNWGSCILCVHM